MATNYRIRNDYMPPIQPLPQTEEEWLTTIAQHPFMLLYHPNPGEKEQLLAASKLSNTLDILQQRGITPSRDVIMQALKTNGDAIMYVDDPDEEMQMTAVKTSQDAIWYMMRNGTVPSDDVMIHDLQTWSTSEPDGRRISLYKNPSQRVRLAALEIDPRSLSYINDPSAEEQILAIRQLPRAITMVPQVEPETWDNPEVKSAVIKYLLEIIKGKSSIMTKVMFQDLNKKKCPWPEVSVMERRLRSSGLLKESTAPKDEAAIIQKIQQDPWAIVEIKHPTEAMQLAAVNGDADVITAILRTTVPSEAVQIAAVEYRGELIEDIIARFEPSDAVKIAAVSDDAYAIRFMKNASEAVLIAAVSKDADVLGMIISLRHRLTDKVKEAAILRRPQAIEILYHHKIPVGEDLELLAVETNPIAIHYIPNPSDKVQIAALRLRPGVIKYIMHPAFAIWKDPQVKNNAIRYILDSAKSGDRSWAAGLALMFRNKGCPWPEMRVLERKLKPLLEGHDYEEYSNAWRAKLEFQEFLTTMWHDLRSAKDLDDWQLVVMDLMDMGYTDIEDVLSDKDMALLNSKKKEIIAAIIEEIKTEPRPLRVRKAITALNNIGVRWPELAAIDRRLEKMQKR